MGNWCKEIFGNIASLIGIIALIVVLILAVFRITIPFDKLDNTGIIISFIGVLATFVVIGNFAQTSRIENSIEDKISKLADRVKTCEDNDKQLTGIKTSITEHSVEIGEIKAKINDIEQSSKSVDKRDLARLLKLFVGKESDVRKYMQLFARMLDPQTRYNIELINGTKRLATIKFDGKDDYVFEVSARENIAPQDVRKISGLPFSHEDILFAYQLLNELALSDIDSHEEDTQKEDLSEEKNAQEQEK